MLLYILVVLFPLAVGLFFEAKVADRYAGNGAQTKTIKRQRWRWLAFAALPMFSLIAFRAIHLGSDTGGYLSFFERIADTPWDRIFAENDASYQFEPGFVVFEKLVTVFTHSPQAYQVIYSTIYLISIVTFANQLEKGNFSFLFLFATMGTYTFMFTGVRQCLAMCICLWSYPFIKKRKLVPFLILLILAFTFHKSAILFVAAYFIYNRKINWINTFIYVIIGTLSFLYIDVIQEWFNDQLDYDYGVEETGNGIIFFAVIAVVTAFSFFALVYYKKKTPESVGLLNVGIITFVFWFLRLVTRVAERPSFYFVFFSAAMLCYALDAPTNDRDKITYKMLVYSAFMILFVYRLFTSHASLVPYDSFF